MSDTENPVVYHINVIHDHETVERHRARNDDTRESTTRWEITGLELVSENDPYEVMTHYPVKKGEEYYLLYAVMTESDSFSISHDRRIEFIDVYSNKDLAEENMEILRCAYSNPDVILKRELADGTTDEYKYHVSWIGWGTGLSYLEVMPMYLTTRTHRVYPDNR